MRVQVTLPAGGLRVEPGGHTTCLVRVRNLDLAADRLTFEVVGPAASWATLDPPVLTLPAEATAQVTVHLHPPRAAHIRAGATPFGLLTTSSRDGCGRVVEQLLEIGRFTDVAVELVPRGIRRASGTYQLSVANRGNATVRLTVRGRDLAGAVAVHCTPAHLTVFPGTSVTSRVRVRPVQPHWRGTPISRPFQIVVDLGEGTPLMIESELVHHAILPR